MSVENINLSKEFEQKLPFEVERKYLPIFPEQMEKFRAEARPIEQFYLSHPSEDFSLRLRETLGDDGQLHYRATLKSTGRIDDTGLKRLEVESDELSQELYNFYRSDDTPIIRKLRAEPLAGIAIDFFEDGHMQVESENELSWLQFTAEHGDRFVEITGDHSADNQWRAHLSFRRTNNGQETLQPAQEIVVEYIVSDVLKRHDTQPVVVHIAGRSGSGKSTIVRKLQEQLNQYSLTSAVLSTDDYHRGASYLRYHNNGQPWERWDDPFVYDTATMAIELDALRSGKEIYNRKINWQTAEPYLDGSVIMPAEVIIIEGIYARSPDITHDDDLVYEMTTPLATCIGRRLLRDLKERPEFTDPAKSLTYMLEQAEPMYRAQTTPEENHK